MIHLVRLAALLTAPAPRSGHALVYEGDTVYGDTQEWDGTQWRLVSEDGPGVRNHHAMVYDKARGVMVLFGGQDRDITLQGDTWEWDGTSWRRAATSGPSARVHHAMVWDDVRQRVLLFGGSNGQGDLGDFWEWDGSSWRPISAQGPGPRAAHRMAFHAGEGKVYLYGGFGADNRVWIWNGQAWSQFAGTTPPSRSHHAMAYHEARGSMVVFGGYQGDNVGDTWELIGGVAAGRVRAAHTEYRTHREHLRDPVDSSVPRARRCVFRLRVGRSLGSGGSGTHRNAHGRLRLRIGRSVREFSSPGDFRDGR